MFTDARRQLFYMMSFVWLAGAPVVFAIGLFFLAYGGETPPQRVNVSSSAITTIELAARQGPAGSRTIIYGHPHNTRGSIPGARELGCHLSGNTAIEAKYFDDSLDSTLRSRVGGQTVTALTMILSADQTMRLTCDSAALRQVEPLYTVVSTRPEPVNRFPIAGIFFVSTAFALIFGTASFFIFRPNQSNAYPSVHSPTNNGQPGPDSPPRPASSQGSIWRTPPPPKP
jgi:hypothetical protein